MEKNSPYKKVLWPIEVPDNDYCWDGHTASCTHFDNTGGHGTCELHVGSLKRDKEGVYPKPPECKKLINQNYFDALFNPVKLFG
jgi:hypothetical protein